MYELIEIHELLIFDENEYSLSFTIYISQNPELCQRTAIYNFRELRRESEAREYSEAFRSFIETNITMTEYQILQNFRSFISFSMYQKSINSNITPHDIISKFIPLELRPPPRDLLSLFMND